MIPTKTQTLFNKAQQLIPGGVNSPVRAFKGVGGTPIFFECAQGAYLYDVDDQAYIDYVGSWGPMILGHNHPQIIAAVSEQLHRAISFGAPTALEIEMAELITTLMPAIEMVRMVNSGTEATMSAIRLARGFTGRDKIIKFTGCYHGHSDSLLIEAGSGALTIGVPSSPGVPASLAEHTLVAEFNNIESVAALFHHHGHQIAAIIVEPIAGNMGCIPAKTEFLKALREICDHYQALLIFDEVMTGFRVALGGATSLYQIQPDLITLAKIIGGGFPVGAFGGKREIMQQLAPSGPIYQAGTLSGNPVAMTAGITILKLLQKHPEYYQHLQHVTDQLANGIQKLANYYAIPLIINTSCAMFSLFFTEHTEVTNFADVMSCNIPRFQKFFHSMLQENIYLAPSAFESLFLSTEHGDKEITLTLQAVEKIFKAL